MRFTLNASTISLSFGVPVITSGVSWTDGSYFPSINCKLDSDSSYYGIRLASPGLFNNKANVSAAFSNKGNAAVSYTPFPSYQRPALYKSI